MWNLQRSLIAVLAAAPQGISDVESNGGNRYFNCLFSDCRTPLGVGGRNAARETVINDCQFDLLAPPGPNS